ncbi:MAG: hypothetical protein KF760_04990 [Candidatus Eremiobacteraeota bacterium]|nr:hypothetical protein [Candidatus Eremiobacteraeota bacterium]
MQLLYRFRAWFWGWLAPHLPLHWRFAAKRARLRQAWARWHRSGRPLPPPHEVKQLQLLNTQRQYGYKVLVETGTFRGDMMIAMHPYFEKLYSIELSQELHQAALVRLRAYPKATLLQGDSGKVLANLTEALAKPAIFWLDGHYSAGDTALGDLETPIRAELEAVLSHSVPHAVIIDDARLFNGSRDYPTLAQVESIVKDLNSEYRMHVCDDTIQILPPQIPR